MFWSEDLESGLSKHQGLVYRLNVFVSRVRIWIIKVEKWNDVFVDAVDIVKTFHAETVKVGRGGEESDGN